MDVTVYRCETYEAEMHRTIGRFESSVMHGVGLLCSTARQGYPEGMHRCGWPSCAPGAETAWGRLRHRIRWSIWEAGGNLAATFEIRRTRTELDSRARRTTGTTPRRDAARSHSTWIDC